MSEISKQLDARGLDCPLPLLKMKQALNKMASNDVLEVLATDAGSERDFVAFAKQSGNVILDSQLTAGVYRYVIQKK